MATFTKTITVNCPRCSSDKVVKRGKGKLGEQTYACKSCNGRFYQDRPVKGRRASPKQVASAVDMYYDGLSYKVIADNLAAMYDVPPPSKATIFEWVRDHTKLAMDEMKPHKAHTGPEWVADEMVVKVGGRNMWLWNVMDSQTRYLLASLLHPRRDTRAATAVIRRALANSANPPKRIKTDRLASYIDAIERVFGGEVEHVQSEGIRAELNNNMSERLQGTFRARTKTLRGLQTLDSGQTFLDGWTINYNLFRPHESLGNRRPAEVARLGAPFREWEDFTKMDTSRFSKERREEEAARKRYRDRTFPTSRRRGF